MKNYKAASGEVEVEEKPVGSGMFVTQTGAVLKVKENPTGSCKYCYFYDKEKERAACDDADYKQGPCSSATRSDKKDVVFMDKPTEEKLNKEMPLFGKKEEEKKKLRLDEGIGMKSFLAAALLAGAPTMDVEAAKAKSAKKAMTTAVASNTTRGLRNNNPGNIISNSIKWQGKIGTDGRFIKFDTMENGVRALARILKVYQRKYKIDTIEGIIKKWAPPVENNTEKYIQFVSKNSGIDRKAKLNLQDSSQLYRVVDSIIKFENGKSVDGGIIARGLKAEIGKK